MHMREPRMTYETILYDVSERISTITFNRPEKLNAWMRQRHLDLKNAMHKVVADPELPRSGGSTGRFG